MLRQIMLLLNLLDRLAILNPIIKSHRLLTVAFQMRNEKLLLRHEEFFDSVEPI